MKYGQRRPNRSLSVCAVLYHGHPDLTAASLYVLCYTMGLDPEMILCNCKLVVLVLGTVLVSELGEGLGALQHRPLGGGAFVAG